MFKKTHSLHPSLRVGPHASSPHGFPRKLWQYALLRAQARHLSAVESVLCSGINVWHRNCTVAERKAPQRAVKAAQRVQWRTSEWLDNGPRISSQCLMAVRMALPVKFCVSLHGCFSRPSLTHHQTSHAERCYRQHNVLHGFSWSSHLSHVVRANLLSSLKSTGLTMAGPLSVVDLVASRKHKAHHSMLGTQSNVINPFSEHFVRNIDTNCLLEVILFLAELSLFILAQRSRYWWYWTVNDRLQPCSALVVQYNWLSPGLLHTLETWGVGLPVQPL